MQRKLFMLIILTVSVIMWVGSPFMARRQVSALVIPSGGDQILLVSSFDSDQVLVYDGTTGVALGELITPAGTTLDGPTGIAVGPDGSYYVASYATDEILRYESHTWQFKDVFVPAGSGGLFAPQGITFGPDNHLYVSSGTPHHILRFDGQTGEFMDIFAEGGGLSLPQGLTFAPDGHLYVADMGQNEVLRFDGATGVYSDTFTSGESLNLPTDLKFASDGHLYVSSSGNNAVFRFDGNTGFFLDAPASGSELDAPKGLAFGADEQLYVANSGQFKNNVANFNRLSGEFKGEFVASGAGGLSSPTYLLLTEMMITPTATPSPTTAATLTPSITPSPTATTTPGLSCDEVPAGQPAITWQVNTTQDNLVDAITLRCALTYARSGDTIDFDPAVFPPDGPATILLTEALPDITQGNLVLGGSGTGVILDGRNLPASTVGLRLRSDGNTIRGLQIVRMTGSGLQIEGDNNTIGGLGAQREAFARASVNGPPNNALNVINLNGSHGISVEGSHNLIQGNYIGTQADGLQIRPNEGSGIYVSKGQENQIGGANGLGNLISGNRLAGIEILGENSLENKIEGNFIGTDLTGSNALANEATGIEIYGDANQNMIGSTQPGTGNLLSGNQQSGIYLGAVFSTTVQNNIVGADINGNNAIPNAQNGIWLFESGNTLIGEAGISCSTPCNLISGNTGSGILISGAASQENQIVANFIGTDKNGQAALANSGSGVYLADGASQNLIGDAQIGVGNLLSGNFGAGVLMTGEQTSENRILGNHIGVDVSVLQALGNRYGVEIRDSANNNTIGGVGAGPSNIIAGNHSHGVYIFGSETAHNTVAQNYIGANRKGQYVGGNGGAGVMVEAGAHDNVIGIRSDQYRGNIIVQNQAGGVSLSTARKNEILGNRIGEHRNGDPLGNSAHGVSISNNSTDNKVTGNRITHNAGAGVHIAAGSQNNQVGQSGDQVRDYNLILLNQSSGVDLEGQGTTNNAIINNFIGTDKDARDNLGNQSVGIHLQNGPQQTLIDSNRIVNSNSAGIALEDADNNEIGNNLIGITSNRVGQMIALGNRGHGVQFFNGAVNNLLFDNTIASNLFDGVRVEGPNTIGNSMTQNRIYENRQAGITLNEGGNRGLQAPTISQVSFFRNTYTIRGNTCANCVAQLFSDNENEGQMYLGFVDTDANGSFNWVGFKPLNNLTLTTTDGEGNTSAFGPHIDFNVLDDVEGTALEITQAIQSLDNQVELIAGKQTYARFHVRGDTEQAIRATTRLRAWRNDEYLGSIGPTGNGCDHRIVVQSQPDRGQLDDSFCFRLPNAWTQLGTLELEAVIDPTDLIPETQLFNNGSYAEVEFIDSPTFNLNLFQITYREGMRQRWVFPKDDEPEFGFTTNDGLASGDIDGDGQYEVLIAENQTGTVEVWGLPAAGGSFTVSTTFEGGFSNDDGIAVGNVDGDNRNEVLIANDQSGQIEVFGWNGANVSAQGGFDGGFTHKHLFAVGNLLPGEIPDEVIVGNDASNQAHIYQWDGATWSHQQTIHLALAADDQLAVGDVLNGDGLAELVVGRPSSGRVLIYERNGNSWQNSGEFEWDFTAQDRLVVGDVDGEAVNGRMLADIVLARDSCDCFDVYQFNPPNRFFWASRSDGFAGDRVVYQAGDGVVIGDVNNDGRAEFINGGQINWKVEVFSKRLAGNWRDIGLPDSHTSYLKSYLRRTFPTSRLNVNTHRLYYPREKGTPSAGEVMDVMKEWLVAQGEPLGIMPSYGMVNDIGGFFRGLGVGGNNGGSRTAVGPSGCTINQPGCEDTISFDWDSDGYWGDWYGAHEIGHTMGQGHIAGVRNEQECNSGTNVYPGGIIGGAADATDRFYGFDVGDAALDLPLRIYDGTEWHDFMTYCHQQWISDFTFNGLRNEMNSLMPRRAKQQGNFLFVSGQINRTQGTGKLGASLILSDTLLMPSVLTDTSELTLRLDDRNGQPVATYALNFDTDSEPEEGEDDLIFFDAIVPYVADASLISFLYQDTVIMTRTVSATAPQVSLLSPNGGQTLTDTVTIRWEGSDSDGDSLHYNLLYSSDGGQQWETLVTQWGEKSYTLDTTQLAGTTTGRFRIMANDGLLTTHDDSDSDIIVPFNAPQAAISWPPDGSNFESGQSIILNGTATDPDGLPIDENNLSWTSDLNGLLGNGKEVLISELLTGTHTITLSVTDNGGQTSESTIKLSMNQTESQSTMLYLPVVVR